MSRVMIVTGGSSGIGAETALIAAERGHAVAVGYHEQRARAGAIATQIRERGGRAIAVPCDVRLEADVMRLFETVDQELGRVSVLVNSAGLSHGQARLVDMSAARIERVMATNVIGSLLCAREAVRRMSTARGGSGGVIVNLSSAAARLGSASTARWNPTICAPCSPASRQGGAG